MRQNDYHETHVCRDCGVEITLPYVKADQVPPIPLDDRCDIIRNGDQFICRIHYRHWATGICPGIR